MSEGQKRTTVLLHRGSRAGQCLAALRTKSRCTEKQLLGFKLSDKVFSHTFEWEERMRLCTKELVMIEVAMECHGNRFRKDDHSTVSLEPLKETLFNAPWMHLSDDTTGVHDRVVEEIRHDDHWCSKVMTTDMAWTGLR